MLWSPKFQVKMSLHKKWRFPLKISSVNVIKSAENCGFGHIYWRNKYWKTSFLCSVASRWVLRWERRTFIRPPSKEKGLRDIGHAKALTRHKKIFSWVLAMVTASYLVYYDALLQNETDITKRDNYFITNQDKCLL